MIFTLARKEWRILFRSPLAWTILAVLQCVFACLFLSQIEAYLGVQTQLLQLANPPGFTELIVLPLYATAALVMMMAIPLLTMRSIAEERRNQTFSLLLSAPVSDLDIILGKYLALVIFVSLPIALLMSMAFALRMGGAPDNGLIISNTLGLFLLTASFGAAGLFISSLTTHPTLAGMGTLGILLGLWTLNISVADPDSPIHTFSLLKHFDSFSRGMLDTGDIAYYLLFTAAFLILAVRRIHHIRHHA
jgi:ABC-2 type transport system permease protein